MHNFKSRAKKEAHSFIHYAWNKSLEKDHPPPFFFLSRSPLKRRRIAFSSSQFCSKQSAVRV